LTELLMMFLISGAILVALSIPMIMGKVTPNSIYGFRVPETMNDPRTWYAVNAYSGKWLLFTGLIFMATCILAYIIPGISVDTYSLICMAGFFIPMTIGFIKSWIYMKQLKTEKQN
jgi:uncharacterized membrane protein